MTSCHPASYYCTGWTILGDNSFKYSESKSAVLREKQGNDINASMEGLLIWRPVRYRLQQSAKSVKLDETTLWLVEFSKTHTHRLSNTNLRCTAHAVLALAGSHQQQVAMLVNLVVDRSGQADFTGLRWDGEETAGVDEEAVADWFLLEGYSRSYQEAGKWEKNSVDRNLQQQLGHLRAKYTVRVFNTIFKLEWVI